MSPAPTTPTKESPIRRRRRCFHFRFGLRVVLVFVASVGAFCAFVVRPAIEQRAIVRQLEKSGASVGYDHDTGPSGIFLSPARNWLSDIVGFDLLHTATAVRGSGADVRLAIKLPHLELLDLARADVFDRDLKAIGGAKALKEARLDVIGAYLSMSEIEVAELRAPHITDAGLAFLEGLPALERLSLVGRSWVTDAGIAHLATLRRLRALDLRGTYTTNKGLESLQGLPSLEELNLEGCRAVGDAGMNFIGRITSLRLLNLAHTRVTDAGLAELRGLGSLESMNLENCDVSDAGITSLEKIRTLRHLNLADTNVSDGQRQRLESNGVDFNPFNDPLRRD